MLIEVKNLFKEAFPITLGGRKSLILKQVKYMIIKAMKSQEFTYFQVNCTKIFSTVKRQFFF